MAFIENVTLDPIDYGYVADDEGLISLRIVDCETIPDDFPLPCNCLKYAKSSVCPCRMKNIKCCDFCRCGASVNCKNAAP